MDGQDAKLRYPEEEERETVPGFGVQKLRLWGLGVEDLVQRKKQRETVPDFGVCELRLRGLGIEDLVQRKRTRDSTWF